MRRHSGGGCRASGKPIDCRWMPPSQWIPFFGQLRRRSGGLLFALVNAGRLLGRLNPGQGRRVVTPPCRESRSGPWQSRRRRRKARRRFQLRSWFSQTKPVVLLPANGSRTRSSGSVRNCTKKPAIASGILAGWASSFCFLGTLLIRISARCVRDRQDSGEFGFVAVGRHQHVGRNGSAIVLEERLFADTVLAGRKPQV